MQAAKAASQKRQSLIPLDKVMGGDAVKKGEEMKKNIDQAMKEEARRLLKMDKETQR
ncbi:MAG: hypothetical protein MZU95_14745 [Desulfomicrobium escambiense]|nr:hypothetical protein [Desulfomicrobium escambiense]